jgi:hypothetical protein
MLAARHTTETPTDAIPQRAVLTFAALADFMTHLRANAARYGGALTSARAHPDEIPQDGFDLDVEGIALATAAKIFAFDEGVIALIDDAQYHRRPIHIARTRGGAPVMMAAALSGIGTSPDCARHR